MLKVPLLVNGKTDLPLLLTPKPQDCLPESNLPGLSLQILPGTCNWSEIQEKRAFGFACTRVICYFRLAKRCLLHLTLLCMLLVEVVEVWTPYAFLLYMHGCPHSVVTELSPTLSFPWTFLYFMFSFPFLS